MVCVGEHDDRRLRDDGAIRIACVPDAVVARKHADFALQVQCEPVAGGGKLHRDDGTRTDPACAREPPAPEPYGGTSQRARCLVRHVLRVVVRIRLPRRGVGDAQLVGVAVGKLQHTTALPWPFVTRIR